MKKLSKLRAAPSGRPSMYTEALGDEIVDRHANGETLTDICRDERMPHVRTVLRWAAAPTEFSKRYEMARFLFADAVFDQALSIADNKKGVAQEEKGCASDHQKKADVARDRLRVDVRLRIVAKINPTKYGDRLALHHSGGISLEGVDDATLNTRIERRLHDLGVIALLTAWEVGAARVDEFLALFRIVELPTAAQPIRLLPGETDLEEVKRAQGVDD